MLRSFFGVVRVWGLGILTVRGFSKHIFSVLFISGGRALGFYWRVGLFSGLFRL